ncbi:MAG TPA: CYTH and CHAD domain-containing protein [Nitrospiria bacterium]|nr:CYTH and CHAD domain-containing protein [Nitrospiria bacterium]
MNARKSSTSFREAGSRETGLRASIERETKLSVDSTFRLPKLPGRTLPKRVLTSTYYDARDYRLAHAGITLRRRVERRSSLWQLKLPSEDGRREVEIAGGPDAVPAPLARLLIAHLRGDEAVPVATLRTWRTGVRVRGPAGPVADVLLDTVSVLQDWRVTARFRELEIERLDGDAALIEHLEGALREAGAGDHDGRPKLFQALGLPSSPGEPPAADAPIADHLMFMLGRQVTALLAHDPGTRLGGEIEDVHQMRVATRRLRTVLRVARPLLDPEWIEPLRAELAWLGGLLGPARDLDVQMSYFRDEAATLKSRDRRPLERFIEHLGRTREAAQRTLVDQLESPRYLKLVGRLLLAASQPPVVASQATLAAIAAREFKKLRRAMKQLGRTPSHATLHRARIQTKRARYAAELAQAVVGKPAARFTDQAKLYQDLLGVHQDSVLAEQHIRALLASTHGLRTAFVAGRMVERQRQRRENARAALPARWKKLKKLGKKAWRDEL